MDTIISYLRQILGQPNFYRILSGNNYTWDYAAMIEYFVAAMIVLIVISNIFRFLRCLIKN